MANRLFVRVTEAELYTKRAAAVPAPEAPLEHGVAAPVEPALHAYRGDSR